MLGVSGNLKLDLTRAIMGERRRLGKRDGQQGEMTSETTTFTISTHMIERVCVFAQDTQRRKVMHKGTTPLCS